LDRVPVPSHINNLERIATEAIALKRFLSSPDMTDASFLVVPIEGDVNHQARVSRAAVRLHILEGWNERLVCDGYGLDEGDVEAVLSETGVPAGWFPLVAGYDQLPEPPEGIEVPEGLEAFLGTLDRLELSAVELDRLRGRLKTAYLAGPGGKVEYDGADEEPADSPDEDDDEGRGEVAVVGGGALIPIPTETFLEELSQKLEVHPITVFWLLEELHAAGVVSPPVERERWEDYVSVSVLRMLGHRWPEQDTYEAEHGPILDSDLVDPDGIIPLVAGMGQDTMADRIRLRLERQFGEHGAMEAEQLFRRFTGNDLDTWLTKDFFKKHAKQFKQRPIGWHLTSPEGTIQLLVLYHKLSRTTLQTIRAKYAGTLIQTLKAEQEQARQRGNTGKVSDLQAKIEDIEEFRTRIEAIERGDQLDDRIRCRWKDETKQGRPGPYTPDINDGVKVNLRPFQQNQLLPNPVIKKW
jgi:hypothetical protein